jgi:hypothetical protein
MRIAGAVCGVLPGLGRFDRSHQRPFDLAEEQPVPGHEEADSLALMNRE